MTENFKEQINDFFQRVEEPSRENESSLTTFVASIGMLPTPFKKELAKANSSMGDEEYNKFSAALAEDSRLAPYLPSLAMSALSSSSRPPRVNYAIDSDLSRTLSKSEVSSAANDPSKFDPVHRKALKYVEENFDKFRGLSTDDGSFIGNSWDITSSDVKVGLEEVMLHDFKRRAVPDMQAVVSNFETIDANQSGKITASEVYNWSRENKLNISHYAVPNPTNRQMKGSEELSKQDYIERMVKFEAEVKAMATKWGLK